MTSRQLIRAARAARYAEVDEDLLKRFRRADLIQRPQPAHTPGKVGLDQVDRDLGETINHRDCRQSGCGQSHPVAVGDRLYPPGALAHQRAVREWRGERPDPAVFTREILPGLREHPIPALTAATGLSAHYCSLIRLGKKVPHPRHWELLRNVRQAR